MSRFDYPDFLEWTETLVVDMNEFHRELVKKYGTYDINVDKYNTEYEEWLWSKYEREHLFHSWDEVEDFIFTALESEYIKGDPIYAFFTVNDAEECTYQVTTDYENRLPGFEDVIL